MKPIVVLGEVTPEKAELYIELFLVAPTVALYTATGVTLPPIGSSGIRYRREPAGKEEWVLPHVVLDKKYGDCEDLSLYLTVWLRMRGAKARVLVRRARGGGYHATVETGLNPAIHIDPSRLLGM